MLILTSTPGIVGLIVAVLFLIPSVKILRRTGHSGWWVLLWLVPVVNLVFFWIFAYARWPAFEPREMTT
jgi:hypothetical protein